MTASDLQLVVDLRPSSPAWAARVCGLTVALRALLTVALRALLTARHAGVRIASTHRGTVQGA